VKPAQAYLAIRIAMMSGLLLFGAVAWFLHQRPDWQPPDEKLVGQLRMFGRVLGGVSIVALIFAYDRFRKAETRVQSSTWAIIGWSLGETIALFGAVHFYLTGVSSWYIAGMILMSITFIAFRPPALR
jgi:hypothetical protein